MGGFANVARAVGVFFLAAAAIVMIDITLQANHRSSEDSLLQTSKIQAALAKHAAYVKNQDFQQYPFATLKAAALARQVRGQNTAIQSLPIVQASVIRGTRLDDEPAAAEVPPEAPPVPAPEQPPPAAQPALPPQYFPQQPAAPPQYPQYPQYPPTAGQYPQGPYGQQYAMPPGAGYQQYPPAYGNPFGAPQNQCAAATQCTDTMNSGISEANGLRDRIQQLQASCQALTTMVHCMCDSCASTVESDPNFVQAHETYCGPVMMAQFRLAGGACNGFASGYCSIPMDSSFCENFAVPPVLGSAQWMSRHEVVDPGEGAAAAGVDLFSNQLPQYAQQVADSLSKYFTAAAAAQAAKARLTDAVISEIDKIGPKAALEAGGDGAAAAGTNSTAASGGWYCMGVFC